MNEALLVAIIASVVGPVAVATINGAFSRAAKKDASKPGRRKGENTKDPRTVSGIVLEWANQLSEDVERVTRRLSELEDEVKSLKRENAKLRRHNELLSTQVRDLGGKPWPMPE